MVVTVKKMSIVVNYTVVNLSFLPLRFLMLLKSLHNIICVRGHIRSGSDSLLEKLPPYIQED